MSEGLLIENGRGLSVYFIGGARRAMGVLMLQRASVSFCITGVAFAAAVVWKARNVPLKKSCQGGRDEVFDAND
jgi:hypothetical protein